MFREMRRKGQQITAEECMEILRKAKTGVLGLHGENGYPYTVPLNFVYTPPAAPGQTYPCSSAEQANPPASAEQSNPPASAEQTNSPASVEQTNSPTSAEHTAQPQTDLGTIGFHCAKTGHKIDAIRANEKVSFTVIERDEVMPKERTTKYCSVIAFGRARILEGEENLRRAANALGAKYSAGYEDLYREETEDTIRRGTLCCVEITIDHMTGKIGKELLKERKAQSK